MISKKSNQNTSIYFIGYKASNYLKPLFLTFDKINDHIEGCPGIKCLTLIPFSEKRHD